jgi:lactoylglutathione lyase
MYIHHIAIWSEDIENLKNFYIKYFDCTANNKYRNESKNYESYFISFPDGAKIELMQMPGIPLNLNDQVKQYHGLIHFAISTGSKEKVIEITEKIRKDGFSILSEPRTTGDGYFESCIADTDGNRIEITI